MLADLEHTRELNPPPSAPPYSETQVYDTPLDIIFADDKFNCRGFIAVEGVEDLARNIRLKGLIQPILLQPWDAIPGKRFRIVAGYRRFKATRLNATIDGQPKWIPSLIKENISDFDARILNLSENLMREMLDMKQEALALQHFKLAGWTEQETASQLKMSRGWVQVRYMLLELPDEIQDEAAAGMFTNQQIRDLFELDNRDDQYELAKKMKDAKLNGNRREVLASNAIRKNAKRVRKPSEIFEVQDLLIEHFGHSPATKVCAWAGGAIDDVEFRTYLVELGRQHGITIPMPTFRVKSKFGDPSTVS